MSHIWTFSPSSEMHLQRCLAAAPPRDCNNKWIRQFNLKVDLPKKTDTKLEENTTTQGTEITCSIENSEKIDILDTYDDFLDAIETERFDIIVAECIKNNNLVIKIAERLSMYAVEKLMKHIFKYNSINNVFLEVFFTIFLPTYIKREYTRLSLDFLIQINKIYPDIFKILLEILIKDIEIPNAVLNDLTLVLNENEKTKFLTILTDIELSTKTFIHNILTIYSAYKDCIKTDRIQSYILTNLVEHSENCTKDKNYGRLFLTYLQTEKYLQHNVDDKIIQDLLDKHMSPFKRPCMLILKDIIE